MVMTGAQSFEAQAHAAKLWWWDNNKLSNYNDNTLGGHWQGPFHGLTSQENQEQVEVSRKECQKLWYFECTSHGIGL